MSPPANTTAGCSRSRCNTGSSGVPEWAPPGKNHLLGSSSVVQKIAYSASEVRYTPFDAEATEVLRLAFSPARVTVGAAALAPRPDLSKPGWTFDATKGVLRVRRQRSRDVVISG